MICPQGYPQNLWINKKKNGFKLAERLAYIGFLEFLACCHEPFAECSKKISTDYSDECFYRTALKLTRENKKNSLDAELFLMFPFHNLLAH
ncbi:hypothetical protein Loa_02003 [Legionella oakridgensis ATCC 33761 = DSM 21215]|uniref:Uncharacterized protein n=1 Tax=Legionella oakridgensis ATCC 33761 = DSM 21215 TaxID=1268635 RepID=W0BFY9_9GAMM|nr:hypothetical protein Loa_02003 [Legionella oakridgensis ATCC 33761 = DSM 21215]